MLPIHQYGYMQIFKVLTWDMRYHLKNEIKGSLECLYYTFQRQYIKFSLIINRQKSAYSHHLELLLFKLKFYVSVYIGISRQISTQEHLPLFLSGCLKIKEWGTLEYLIVFLHCLFYGPQTQSVFPI